MTRPLHQRATLDAHRIEPPPRPLPDPDVTYDRVVALAALARALDPSLPRGLRFVRRAPSDASDRNSVSFRAVFTRDERPVPKGGIQDSAPVDLWDALSAHLPARMVQAERQNLEAGPSMQFAAAADAAVYAAFRGGRVGMKTVPTDDPDYVIQASGVIVPEPLAFLGEPSLARWIYLAPTANLNDREHPAIAAIRVHALALRQILSRPLAEASGQEQSQARQALEALGPSRREGSFEEAQGHGWIAYALAAGGKGWTPFLLAAGANPFTPYNTVSPIAWAIAGDDGRAVQALVDAGVSPSTLLQGVPPVYGRPEQQELNRLSERFVPLVVLGSLVGASQAVAALLKAGASPDASTEHQATGLHFAAQNGDERLVRTLLSHGANPSAENLAGLVPSELVPAGADGELLYELLETSRLGSAHLPPPSAVGPQDQEDAYGEPVSFWEQATAPPRRRSGPR